MIDVVLLIGKKIGGVVVDSDGSDFIADPVELAAALAGVGFAGDFFDDIQTIGDLTEHRVAVVEERGWGGGDEKLGAVGSWAGVGHGEYTRCAVTEIGVEFISEFVTRAAAAAFGWIAALQHETFDHAVEGNAIVISALGEIEEVRASDGCFGGVKGCVDVACGGVECDFNIVHDGEISLTSECWGNLAFHPSHISIKEFNTQ